VDLAEPKIQSLPRTPILEAMQSNLLLVYPRTTNLVFLFLHADCHIQFPLTLAYTNGQLFVDIDFFIFLTQVNNFIDSLQEKQPS
jgi:hypothetical protein